MNERQARKLDMLRRAAQFGAEQADRFPDPGPLAEACEAVTAAIHLVETQEVVRGMAAGEGLYSRQTARRQLIRQMDAIRTMARVVRATAPSAGDAFRRPRQQSEADLLNTARAFVADATPLAGPFIAGGLPATFIADLQARVDAYAAAVATRVQTRSVRSSARNRLQEALAAGQQAVDRLDAIINSRLSEDDPAVATWRELRRIGAVSRRPRQAAGPPAPPALPAAA